VFRIGRFTKLLGGFAPGELVHGWCLSPEVLESARQSRANAAVLGSFMWFMENVEADKGQLDAKLRAELRGTSLTCEDIDFFKRLIRPMYGERFSTEYRVEIDDDNFNICARILGEVLDELSIGQRKDIGLESSPGKGGGGKTGEQPGAQKGAVLQGRHPLRDFFHRLCCGPWRAKGKPVGWKAEDTQRVSPSSPNLPQKRQQSRLPLPPQR